MRDAMGKVMVIGGGVAGIQASLDLAELGYYVYLVEKKASIGGIMAVLDKTFPTNDCSICILAPKMVEAGRNPNIEILTLSEVEKVEGGPGDFRVTVRVNPRYIDIERCTACGECFKYCPRLTPDEFNARLAFTRSAHIEFPQAVPVAYYIDRQSCLYLNYQTCRLCTNLCGPKAINFNQKTEYLTLEVGAIILAPGFGDVPKEALKKFGYGIFSDVLTAIEMERLICVSGPTKGEILRPSDLTHPKRIAYIQCVGSRDIICNRIYCSSVCCMYAMKQASLIKDHEPEAEVTIFYMDIRTQGKGFDEAFQNFISKYGIRVVRARPGKVDKVDRKLVLNYVDEEGKVRREHYDMIVLSVGLSPPENVEKLSSVFGIELNEFNFAKTSVMKPIETSRPGIYVIGAFQGPKDIPESVMQASAGAAAVSEVLKEGRFKKYIVKDFPSEDETLISEPPRVGVFVCHCGINIAGVVNVREVVEYAKTLPNVAHAENITYSCSQDALELIKRRIKELRLNRVVVSACTPRTHEPLFQDTLREVGLNSALFEMANIRDQCSWVHADNPKKATEKAKDLVRMAVAKATRLKPLELQKVSVTPAALVVGGGVAGMITSLSLANQGFQVYLVEKERELGGNLRRVRFLIDGENPQKLLKELVSQVENHPLIKVYKGAQLESVSGYIGNFTTTIRSEGNSVMVNHGVAIVAIGGEEYRPTKYPLDGRRILTQLEFEEKLTKKSALKGVKRVVMIQCAGSRGDELSYCSKICCVQALKNALKIKELKPEVEVYILYMDLRAYGFYEKFYLEARKKGIKFIRFLNERRPEITEKGVKVYDPLLGEELLLTSDLIVLSVGIKARDEREIFNMFKLTKTGEGFLMEAHIKLRPVDTYTDGVYISGLIHSPKPLNEIIAQAKAAAGRAAIPLVKGYASIPPIAAYVDEAKCIGCRICADLCPFSAIQMVKKENRLKAQVIKAACKGCGMCVGRCPVFAIDTGGFTNSAILEQVRAFEKKQENKEVKEEILEVKVK